MSFMFIAVLYLMNIQYGWLLNESIFTVDTQGICCYILFLCGVVDIGTGKILDAIKEK